MRGAKPVNRLGKPGGERMMVRLKTQSILPVLTALRGVVSTPDTFLTTSYLPQKHGKKMQSDAHLPNPEDISRKFSGTASPSHTS